MHKVHVERIFVILENNYKTVFEQAGPKVKLPRPPTQTRTGSKIAN